MVIHHFPSLTLHYPQIDTVWVDASIGPESTADEIGETIKKMPYLDLCIKETLRMHPPVQMTQRVNTQSLELKGYKIPAGAMVR